MVIWIAYYIGIFIGFYHLKNDLQVVTYRNAYAGKAGAFGLVKNYYIKVVDTSDHELKLIKKSSNITRPYGGFTLAKLLFPMSSINNAKVVTIYALVLPNKVITHFAASAGTFKASKIRLYIDIFSFLIYKFLILHIGLLIAFFFLRDMYGYIFKSKNVLSQVNAISNNSLLTRVPFYVMAFTLLTLFI